MYVPNAGNAARFGQPFAVLLIVLLALTACNQAGPPDRDRSIAAEMDRYVADGKVAGVVTMVIEDGEPVHEHAVGFRDIESFDKLDVSDFFVLHRSRRPSPASPQ